MSYPKLLASSVNPKELSMTIKGVLTAVVPVVLILAPMFNWSVSQEDFVNFQNGLDGFFSSLEAAIVAVTAAWAAFQIVWGLARKLLVAFKVIKPKN